MFWNKFVKNPYRWLWSKIGGRPWTYIYRDLWHKVEIFPQMQWLVTGITAEYLRQKYHLPWWIHIIWVSIYTYGYINGHFFWGRKYIPGQKGK